MKFLSGLFNKNREDFWGYYRLSNPEEAIAIEIMTGEVFSLLSNKDAKEKVASLERLAKNSECSIIDVKDVFIRSFLSSFGSDDEVIRQALRDSLREISKEAIRFNIREENTAAYYINNWLSELLQKDY